MSTTFMSRVERIDKNINGPSQYTSTAGPGSYDIPPSALKKALPGYAAFSTSNKRPENIFGESQAPPPGAYNLGSGLITKAPTGSTAFKSQTKRFQSYDKEEEPAVNPVEAQFVEKIRQRPQLSPNKSPQKPSNSVQLLQTLLSNGPLSPKPSIPTKAQSFGYEENERTGRLELNKPAIDSLVSKEPIVGPGSYNIKRDIANGNAINFGKSASRDLELKASQSPGPGYYNSYSTFDLADTNRRVYDDKEADFVFRLNASRKKPSSIFASRTERDLVIENMDNPGPGMYNIPSSIQLQESLSPEKQSFGTSGPRFLSDAVRSMSVGAAPGQYSPVVSDFEKNKIKLLKKKKMLSRSGWAQNISFDATEPKFFQLQKESGPPPGAYDPKVNMADEINSGGHHKPTPFGSTADRFRPAEYIAPPKKEEIAARELEKEINASFGLKQSKKIDFKKKPINGSISDHITERFPRPKTPEGPAPNAYDTSPSWATGVVKMAPASTLLSHQLQYVLRKKNTESAPPGPGYYDVPSTISVKKGTTKEVLMSAAPREEHISKYTQSIPGPGTYSIATSLQRPSHNIYLSPGY